jgi:hypothetical protein
MSYGQSKMMIEMNALDRSRMPENINMNISISSMKIKMALTETPSETIVRFFHELSVIKAVYSLPGHHCHYERRVAQHPQRSIGRQS